MTNFLLKQLFGSSHDGLIEQASLLLVHV